MMSFAPNTTHGLGTIRSVALVAKSSTKNGGRETSIAARDGLTSETASPPCVICDTPNARAAADQRKHANRSG